MFENMLLPFLCFFSLYAVLVDRKQLKLLETLTGLIQAFPLEEPQHSNLEENMEQIRGKFRQVRLTHRGISLVPSLNSGTIK